MWFDEIFFLFQGFHWTLLALHILLIAFCIQPWAQLLSAYAKLKESATKPSNTPLIQLFLLPLFMSNFIGICVARSLHYQVSISIYSKILEALIVGKKMNADNNTKNIILISVSGLMSLEVQSCNFWEDGRFFPLWTSKDIKQLTKIRIIFLVLLSEFIFSRLKCLRRLNILLCSSIFLRGFLKIKSSGFPWV